MTRIELSVFGSLFRGVVHRAFHSGVDKLRRHDQRVCQKQNRKLRPRDLKKIIDGQESVHIGHANEMNSHIALVDERHENTAKRIAEA